MIAADAQLLLAEVLQAHGGTERWESLHALEVDVSVWGSLFRLKRRPPLHRRRLRLSTRDPHLFVDAYPRSGSHG